MNKMYYRIGDIGGELRPISFGEFNWVTNAPFDGIEVTNEPFNINNYIHYAKVNGEWVYKPIEELL